MDLHGPSDAGTDREVFDSINMVEACDKVNLLAPDLFAFRNAGRPTAPAKPRDHGWERERHRKPMWLVEVSMAWGWRAAGR